MSQIGFIRYININTKEYDYLGSFNRFLKTNKPYFIYLENPTALYDYTIDRNKAFLAKKKN